MNDAATGMCKNGMHATIFLTEVCLVMLALLDVVYLHTVITFRGEKKSPFIVEVHRENRGLAQRWFSSARQITTEVLTSISLYPFAVQEILPLLGGTEISYLRL